VSGARSAGRGARVAVVDYRAGNLTSVLKGLTAGGAQPFITADAAALADADAVVVPGVGHFGATSAVDEKMRAAILESAVRGRPLLGVCLGLQFLFEESEEAPGVRGLELLPGRCHLLRGDVKVPHVGWNTLERRRDSALLSGVGNDVYAYFTHSYAAPVTDACVASTTYGSTFAAIVETGRIFGVQFHPEKSGEDGLRILRNFVTLC
jgi:imidazole glycerol-phosphate synthase subunit HisH